VFSLAIESFDRCEESGSMGQLIPAQPRSQGFRMRTRGETRKPHPRPQAQARAALTVALVQAVEQLIVIGSFALKECCGWEGNAG
jgi:hypothetical protein